MFEAAGHRTQRTGPGDDPDEGFMFSLGHGVGLAIHEAPSLGQTGRDELVAGDVVAIEPGLRQSGIGEVRFEDLLLVTDDGSETLTDYPLRSDSLTSSTAGHRPLVFSRSRSRTNRHFEPTCRICVSERAASVAAPTANNWARWEVTDVSAFGGLMLFGLLSLIVIVVGIGGRSAHHMVAPC